MATEPRTRNLMSDNTSELNCCDAPMSVVPARPQDMPFEHLWLCRECGHHEPVEDLDEEDSRSEAACAADDLADRLNFFLNAVGSALVDRAYDYAVHMQDPAASAEDFDRDNAAHVERMERGETQARAALEQHLQEHRAILADDRIWGPRLAAESAPDQAQGAAPVSAPVPVVADQLDKPPF